MAKITEIDITKEEMDRLAFEIEQGRMELNRIGNKFQVQNHETVQISEEMLNKSQALDVKIVAFMKLKHCYQNQG